MNKWLFLVEALRKGARLSKAETWKNGQWVSAAMVGFVISGYGFCRAMGWVGWDISDDVLTEIGAAVATLAFTLYQIYATLATSKKVGILPPSVPENDKLREPKIPTPPGSGVEVNPFLGGDQ